MGEEDSTVVEDTNREVDTAAVVVDTSREVVEATSRVATVAVADTRWIVCLMPAFQFALKSQTSMRCVKSSHHYQGGLAA